MQLPSNMDFRVECMTFQDAWKKHYQQFQRGVGSSRPLRSLIPSAGRAYPSQYSGSCRVRPQAGMVRWVRPHGASITLSQAKAAPRTEYFTSYNSR
jgi:hypothetical protein